MSLNPTLSSWKWILKAMNAKLFHQEFWRMRPDSLFPWSSWNGFTCDTPQTVLDIKNSSRVSLIVDTNRLIQVILDILLSFQFFSYDVLSVHIQERINISAYATEIHKWNDVLWIHQTVDLTFNNTFQEYRGGGNTEILAGTKSFQRWPRPSWNWF